MIFFTIKIFMTLLSFIFTQLKHPLSIGLMLLIQTFLTCMYTGMMYQTFWFSYILFLVFLGGMLVLFIYMTSLASNEMFSLSMKLMMLFLVSLIFLFLMFLISDNFMFMNMTNNEMEMINDMNLLMNENSVNLNKLYNYPSNLITLLLINYLFFTLIIVVKITNFFWGPLRMVF